MRSEVATLSVLGALLWVGSAPAQTEPVADEDAYAADDAAEERPASKRAPSPPRPPAPPSSETEPLPVPSPSPSPEPPPVHPAKPAPQSSDSSPKLPAGHPPVTTGALPAGHPPVKPGALLPPGHPPVQGGTAQRGELPPVPLAPPALFPTQLEDEHDEEELVGIHQGRVFIRDPHDNFRFYPGARLRTDLYFPPGAPDLDAASGGSALKSRFAVRRVRFEVSGEILRRLAFTMGVELGGQRIGDLPYAGAQTPRFAPALATEGTLRPAEVSVSYRFRPWLSFTVGQQNVPFSLANRTREYATPLLERNLAIRGFVVPNEKDVGLTVWGELARKLFAYEVGVFSGDGPTQPLADDRPEYVGRLYTRPLGVLGRSTFFTGTQIGISMRHGQRDQEHIGYDYPSIATAGGFVSWQPGYVDSFGRVTHVIPSGAQNAIGGELRIPVGLPYGRAIELRGEAYYVENNTREAVAGFELTNTERFGRIKGVGWYGQVSAWLCGDAFASGEGGGVYRPTHVDLRDAEPLRRGLEVLVSAAGINANYAGATRELSQPDPNTPSADVAIYELGAGVQYWYGRNFRAAFNYLANLTPDSVPPGTVGATNQAIVPSNVAGGDGDVGHELSARLAVTF